MTARKPAPANPRHQQPARSLSRPAPGLYRWRAVKGGPVVAATIEYGPPRDPETGEPLDRCWYWQALVSGQPVGDPEVVPSDTVWAIHESGELIDQQTYDLLVAQAAWDREHKPDAPMANPRKRIDLMGVEPPF